MLIKTLGIDIGISSIGWALVEMDDTKSSNENKIIASGVRIFPKAEHPKDKTSLALPRRAARSQRRLLRRRARRMLEIKKYLSKMLGIPLEDMLEQNEKNKLPTLFRINEEKIPLKEELEQKQKKLFKKGDKSVWELRALALDKKLEARELARVILHIAKRRGYDDITYGMDQDKDGKKLLSCIQENQKKCKDSGYKTIGQMFYWEYYRKLRPNGQMDNVRNRMKDKNPSYNHSVARSELRNELKMIFEVQKSLGSKFINDEFCKTLLGDEKALKKNKKEGLIFYQRPLKSLKNKVGKCEFFREENRAFKDTPSAQKFIALTRIINLLKHIVNTTGIVYDLPDLINQILSKAMGSKTGLSYKGLRTLLKLPDTYQFRELDYSKEKAESAIFIKFTSTIKLASLGIDEAKLDALATLLAENKNWDHIVEGLKKMGLESKIQEIRAQNFKFSKTINLSLKALSFIIPLMQKGMRYDEAIAELYAQGVLKPKKAHQKGVLPPLCEIVKEDSYFEIKNPVVTRALSEFRKVLNAILQKYGKFHYINIELAREVGLSKEERTRIERMQKNNEKENNEAKKLLAELGMKPESKDILRVKLFKMQNETCVYSGQKITIHDLFNGNTQIDHILPLSRSLDDSQNNKILCLAGENQNKRTETPYERFGSNQEQWDEFVERVRSMRLGKERVRKLFNKNFKDRNEGARAEFLRRNLVDTGYISRVVSKYVREYLDFLPIGDKKEHIRIVSGSFISFLRHYWGIGKKDRVNHIHHAQDAIIIACVNPASIQRFSEYLRQKELAYKGKVEKTEKLDEKIKYALRWPMNNFRDNVLRSVESIMVSHKVSHKASGALHEETVRSFKDREYGKTYKGVEGIKRAVELGKLRAINEGVVKNGSMVRIDIFKGKKKKGLYLVPIYTYDIAIGKIPNKACIGGKKDWIEMDEDYEFCFSLYPNDLIEIQTKQMKNPVLGLYKAANISSASITVEHTSSYKLKDDEQNFYMKKGEITFLKEGVGIQTLKVFKKKMVSVLGEVTDAPRAARDEMKNKKS